MHTKTIALVAIGALLGGLLGITGTAAPGTAPASAADARLFDPGNLISDGMFFDGGAMTGAQVQSFLDARVPSCRAGYTCLKSYTQAVPSRAAVTDRCNAYNSQGTESAAMIIAKVGAACGISQKALIVLLEKEQSLVTDTWPGDGQYRKATGYGCPDTAECDSAYYGFFNQVYNAALQFKRYAASPLSWNHIAGRVNNVRFHPNAACGSSAVFIQNQATAGLYNYTPYQPNAAAMANLYGSGDACSAYGNRNFWRLFTDWFGSPTGAMNLARTVDNGTVYVLAGDTKYPIAGLEMLGALGPLGPVGYVSQSYLDGFATGPLAGRILRGNDGSIYFFDSGLKLPFGSCGMVADYGGSCASTGYMQLTDAQLTLFRTGPLMTPVMGTTTGSRYYVTQATKREILDDASQLAAGIPFGYNVLTDGALNALALSTPIVRDQAFAQQRGASSYAFLSAGAAYPVTADGAVAAGLPARAAGALNAASLAKIPAAGRPFAGLVRVGGGAPYILNAGTRMAWLGGGGGSMPSAVPVTKAFVDSYADSGSINVGSFVKTAASGTVYIVGPSDIKPISGWNALLALIPNGTDPTIVTVPAAAVAAMPLGKTALTSGTLVRSPEDATIYLVNGLTDKIPLSSFDYPSSLGIGGFRFVDGGVLAGYPTSSVLLGHGITCGATDYVAAQGTLRALDATTKPLYPLAFTPLDQYTCATLTIGAPATKFIRTPDGSIYLLDGGRKLPVASMNRLAQLGGEVGWVSVSAVLARSIPLGPLA